MPISIVVGGQYGSEGKGKVALYVASEASAAAVVRVGGPNSGHTIVSEAGEVIVFRQLPTAAVLPEVHCMLGAGSYLDVEILLDEVERFGVTPERLSIDPNAMLIGPEDRSLEREQSLRERIGSTLSGTGAAVSRRVLRGSAVKMARHDARLRPYVRSVRGLTRSLLEQGRRVVIEGTQGFGLSLLHSDNYPQATSRDTTAAGFLSEVGLSPLDVDDVVLVIRTFPIRVPGNSGPLPNEVDWDTISHEAGSAALLGELTSVTRRLRRVGRFDPEVVRMAIQANNPSRVALNHLDYIDAAACENGVWSESLDRFLRSVSEQIERDIDLLGVSPTLLLKAAPPFSPNRVHEHRMSR